ncbi:hypothetical protein Taro_002979 [Colocasia esculenta]|uniref:Uncharacterized protein n=1 Tax=Colocasia esculenta TaxID=4460 RepID=A0A843TMY7_COLES|nr:hypothetical protein [Colocasia esculenta]
MVCGARSGTSFGRGIRGRALFHASASSSPLGKLTPPQPKGSVAGPSSVSPTVAAAVGAASGSPPLATAFLSKFGAIGCC